MSDLYTSQISPPSGNQIGTVQLDFNGISGLNGIAVDTINYHSPNSSFLDETLASRQKAEFFVKYIKEGYNYSF